MIKEQAYLLHALSPLHAGIGTTADVIDMPIARMQSTGIPIVPGSSIKGVLRDARNPHGASGDPEHHKWLAVFGPDKNPEEHAGAVVIGDARLLALPVKSFRGTFAFVTSPLLLRLAERDLQTGLTIPQLGQGQALVANDSNIIFENCRDDRETRGDCILLQDIDVTVQQDNSADEWAQALARRLFPDASQDQQIFADRLAIVDDEIMTFLCETATQVDTRIRLDSETGVVAKGALWMEESLPPETVLIGLMAADRSRRKDTNMQADKVMQMALPAEDILQFGGKASVGRGRCRIIPVS